MFVYFPCGRRIEEQVAKRVEEELERRRDEIEAEVGRTLLAKPSTLFSNISQPLVRPF
jgi:hypothetical protein